MQLYSFIRAFGVSVQVFVKGSACHLVFGRVPSVVQGVQQVDQRRPNIRLQRHRTASAPQSKGHPFSPARFPVASSSRIERKVGFRRFATRSTSASAPHPLRTECHAGAGLRRQAARAANLPRAARGWPYASAAATPSMASLRPGIVVQAASASSMHIALASGSTPPQSRCVCVCVCCLLTAHSLWRDEVRGGGSPKLAEKLSRNVGKKQESEQAHGARSALGSGGHRRSSRLRSTVHCPSAPRPRAAANAILGTPCLALPLPGVDHCLSLYAWREAHIPTRVDIRGAI